MIDSGMTIFEISTPLHAKIWSLQNERPVGGLGKASRRGQKRVHSWKTKSDPGYRVDRYGGLAGYMPSGENIGGSAGHLLFLRSCEPLDLYSAMATVRSEVSKLSGLKVAHSVSTASCVELV